MCVRRMIAYVPRFLNSVLKRYGVYDREGFIPKPILYLALQNYIEEGTIYEEPAIKLSGENFDEEWTELFDYSNSYFWGSSYAAIDKQGCFYHSGKMLTKMHPGGDIDWQCMYHVDAGDFNEPAIDSLGNIYISSYYIRYKISPDGEVLWEHEQEGGGPVPLILSSDESYLYAVGRFEAGHTRTDSTVAKINAATGAIVWATPLTDGGSNVNGRWAWLLVDSSDNVYCFNVSTLSGGVRWAKFDADGNIVWQSVMERVYRPAMHNGYIYACTSESSSRIKKYDPADMGSGAIAQSASHGSSRRIWMFSAGSKLYAFWQLGSANQAVYEVNITDLSWTKIKDLSDIYSGSAVALRQVNLKPPVLPDPEEPSFHIYAADLYGRVAKIDSTGGVAWSKEIHSGAAWATPLEDMDVDSDGNIYTVGATGKLIKSDSEGDEVWSWEPEELWGGKIKSVRVCDNGIIIGTNNNPCEIYEVDFDGIEIWSAEIIAANAFVMNIRIDDDGNIYVVYQVNSSPWATHLSKFNSSGILQASVQIDNNGSIDPDDEFHVWWSIDKASMVINNDSNIVYVGGVGYDPINTEDGPQIRGYNFSDLSEASRIRIYTLSGYADQVYDMSIDGDGNIFATIGDGWTHLEKANIFKIAAGSEVARNYSVQEIWAIGVDSSGNAYGVDRTYGMVLKFNGSDLSQYPLWFGAGRLYYTHRLIIGP